MLSHLAIAPSLAFSESGEPKPLLLTLSVVRRSVENFRFHLPAEPRLFHSTFRQVDRASEPKRLPPTGTLRTELSLSFVFMRAFRAFAFLPESLNTSQRPFTRHTR